MSGIEIRQTAASEEQRCSRRGQEGQPTPLHRASLSTESGQICWTACFTKKGIS